MRSEFCMRDDDIKIYYYLPAKYVGKSEIQIGGMRWTTICSRK